MHTPSRNSSPNRSGAGGSNQYFVFQETNTGPNRNQSPANVSHPEPELTHPYPPELVKNLNPDQLKPPFGLTYGLRDKVYAILEKLGKGIESPEHVQEIIRAFMHCKMNPDETATYHIHYVYV